LFSSQSQSHPTTSTDSNKLNYFLDMIKHTRLQADRERKKERKKAKKKKREKEFLDNNYFVTEIQSFKAALLLLLLLLLLP
jgi:hypothetical protein